MLRRAALLCRGSNHVSDGQTGPRAYESACIGAYAVHDEPLASCATAQPFRKGTRDEANSIPSRPTHGYRASGPVHQGVGQHHSRDILAKSGQRTPPRRRGPHRPRSFNG